MGEAGRSRHQSAAEGRRSLKALKGKKSVVMMIDIKTTQLP